MAQSRNFKIRGVDDAISALRDLDPLVRGKILQSAIRKGAVILQQATIDRAPVGETGKLVESIKVSRAGLSREDIALNVIVRPFYSRFIEHGTIKMSAKPFARPAFDESEGEIQRIIKSALKIGIEREVRRKFKKVK